MGQSVPTISVPRIVKPISPIWKFILVYALLMIAIRAGISDALDLDEAEQIFMSQWWLAGYGSQPPLYNWIQHVLLELIPHQVLALSLFKYSLLLITCVVTYQATRLLTNRHAAGLSLYMLALLPVFVFESQRDLSHSVIAMASSGCLFYFTLRVLVVSNRIKDLVWVGLALGTCLMSKYNTLLMAGPLALAILTIPSMRRRFPPLAYFIIPALALLICAVHWLWLFQNIQEAMAPSVEKMGVSQNNGLIESRLNGLLSLITALLGSAGLLFISTALAGGRTLLQKAVKQTDEQNTIEQVFIRYLGIFGLSAILLVAFGAEQLKGRWFAPVIITLPVVLSVGLDYRYQLTERIGKRLKYLALAVAVLCMVAIYGRILFAEQLGFKRLNEPYASLVAQLNLNASDIVVANHPRIAGNVRHHSNGALVFSTNRPTYLHGLHCAQGLTMVWRAEVNFNKQKLLPEETPNDIPEELLQFNATHCPELALVTQGVVQANYIYGTQKRSLQYARWQ